MSRAILVISPSARRGHKSAAITKHATGPISVSHTVFTNTVATTGTLAYLLQCQRLFRKSAIQLLIWYGHVQFLNLAKSRAKMDQQHGIEFMQEGKYCCNSNHWILLAQKQTHWWIDFVTFCIINIALTIMQTRGCWCCCCYSRPSSSLLFVLLLLLPLSVFLLQALFCSTPRQDNFSKVS